MATRIKYNGVTYTSKSEAARAMFAEGMKVSEVIKFKGLDMDYAFAYGVAKRAGFAGTAAARKSVKTVAVHGDTVVIQTAAGERKVSLTTGKFVK
jgi:hypothetical protein